MDSVPRTDGGQEAIWDYFQNEAPESFEGSRARLEFLLKRIRKDARVLNIGCGNGVFERLAVERGLDVHSLDPSMRSIERLRSELGVGDKARVGYIQKIPFPDEAFDVVVASEVLEHLTPTITRQGLADVRRILRPEGKFLGTVPNREDLNDQMVVCPCCGKRFHRWGHEQSFGLVEMISILSEYFEAVKVTARPFVPWGTLNWKGKAAWAVKLLLWRLGIHGTNENLYFEAAKPRAVAPGELACD